MALAGELQISDGNALAVECGDHRLGLVGRHDFVFGALEEDDRAVESIEMVNGGPFDHRLTVADQPEQVLRLELVRVVGEGRQVADPVMAGAGPENGFGGQGAQRCVAAGAAAAYCDARRIDQTLCDQVVHRIRAVRDVDQTPAALQGVAIGSAVAGAAPGS